MAFRAFVGLMALCVASVPLRAQAVAVPVRGIVRDSASGTPLAAAVVRLVALHREVRTHEDGHFELGLVPAGTHELVVQRIGYRALRRAVRVEAIPLTLTFSLVEAPMQMAATVVTGQISERGAADALSTTSVLADAALDRRLDGTLGATVAGLPGVSVGRMGPATARPVVRGMGGDRVLILEDGMRPGDLSATSMDHAVAVEALTAERVEVVRGPMSLLYGSSALGGVVNLIREEIPTAAVDHLHGSVLTQLSSGNTGATAGGVFEAPLGPLAVRAEGTWRRDGDVRTPVGVLANTGASAVNGGVAASLVRPWGYAGVAYRLYDNEYGLPGGFVGAHPGGVDIAMRRHTVRAEADWHGATGLIESARATMTFTDYLHDEVTGSGSVSTRFAQQMTVGEAVARHRPVAGGVTGAWGLRLQYRDVNLSGALRTPSTADWSAGLFAVEELQVGRTHAQAGVRYDLGRFIPLESADVTVGGVAVPAAPRTFGSLSASVGLLRELGGGVRIGSNVSRSFRTPDFNELYSDGPHLAAYSYDVGNPRLDQEVGLGAEAFLRLERERVRAEVAVFSNGMRGYIFARNVGELGRQGERWKFQYVNEDARLSGAEADLSWTLREHLVVEATASMVRGTISGDRDTIPGVGAEPERIESRDLPFIPPLNGRVGLRHETAAWSAGGAVRWAAAQDRLGDFETRTAGFAALDLSFGRRFLVGGRLHALTLRIDNALDAEIRDHLSRTKLIIPDMGRNVALLYRVQF
ncbi:MAG: TonB-dependent receptor [Gemmatimonadota bacterium]|nr:TonB-dependent receptor [Gemmatimonadota bacterium]MDQ8147410.1 TonB-dependent receptor [Gemmatimonadota bacterium]MDQ8149180.1 TonB-dependent receptor [Gemmatimonadota bacterium]MDQ8155925.1 TonB-dependent receptor [Gemmatimonadota bacterium]MDQ8176814.1 TonB-dependent receptor [Gemmatimonadota bacterium]